MSFTKNGPEFDIGLAIGGTGFPTKYTLCHSQGWKSGFQFLPQTNPSVSIEASLASQFFPFSCLLKQLCLSEICEPQPQ